MAIHQTLCIPSSCHSDVVELAASCQQRPCSSLPTSLGDGDRHGSGQMTHGTYNTRQEFSAASARELSRPLCSHTGRVKFSPLVPGIEAEQVDKPAMMRCLTLDKA